MPTERTTVFVREPHGFRSTQKEIHVAQNHNTRANSIEIRYDETLSLTRSTSALLLQPGLDVLYNHDNIMITYLIFLSPYL